MTSKKESIEPKDHERFKVKSGAIAMIRPLSATQDNTRDMRLDGNSFDTKLQYCQIISINKGGLLLRYIDKNGKSSEPAELDLLFIQDSICFTYLKNVPVKTVWVSKVADNTSSSDTNTIQRDVQFGEMTRHQESQLDHFIKKYTI
jgi:hypothetical protein